MAKGIKTGGRKKGTINKVTKDHKERIEFVLGLLEETLEADIKAIGETERIKLWNSLQEFVRPKLARTEMTGEVSVKTITDTTKFTIKAKT